jgi:hypothetical protein
MRLDSAFRYQFLLFKKLCNLCTELCKKKKKNRKVCSKLYFRAEAQQIDRILEAFAKRYWQCNPKTIFGSAG